MLHDLAKAYGDENYKKDMNAHPVMYTYEDVKITWNGYPFGPGKKAFAFKAGLHFMAQFIGTPGHPPYVFLRVRASPDSQELVHLAIDILGDGQHFVVRQVKMGNIVTSAESNVVPFGLIVTSAMETFFQALQVAQSEHSMQSLTERFATILRMRRIVYDPPA